MPSDVTWVAVPIGIMVIAAVLCFRAYFRRKRFEEYFTPDDPIRRKK